MPVDEALEEAARRELDLVEVAPQANPPVCRIMDYGKYRYEQTKREREARHHSHQTKTKEVKFRPNISEHDYETKKRHVIEFLDGTRDAGKRTVLVTNAHSRSLALKMARTGLQRHFDALVCAHDFGYPKEDLRFWEQLDRREPFNPESTLFVDDSLPVLRTARRYGIRHLRAVRRPDSRSPPREIDEFPAIDSFEDIMPV